MAGPGMATGTDAAFDRFLAMLESSVGDQRIQPQIIEMAGGGTARSSRTVNNNYNLSADFSNSNLFPRIADQFRLIEMASVR